MPSGCGSLNDYLRCFETPLAVLQSPEAVEYAAARGLPVRGVILNRYDDTDFLHRDNRDMIPRLTGLPVLACVGEGQASLTLADE